MNVDSTELTADDKRNAAFETMRMSPALQQHIIEQNDPTAGKDGVSFIQTIWPDFLNERFRSRSSIHKMALWANGRTT